MLKQSGRLPKAWELQVEVSRVRSLPQTLRIAVVARAKRAVAEKMRIGLEGSLSIEPEEEENAVVCTAWRNVEVLAPASSDKPRRVQVGLISSVPLSVADSSEIVPFAVVVAAVFDASAA
jgi:hypothetical protein